ncbi:MAG: DMT family transporter [Rikenellaceae bacterium]|nr:DMT family transporter [Rikenellaceae bacterium]
MDNTRGTARWHLMALVTVAIWGTTFVSTKILLGYGLTPAEILFYRFLLAYAAIWFFAPKVIRSRSWRDELLFVAAGLCGGSLYFVTENTALGITLASNVSLILSTTPILTALVWLLFHRRERLKADLAYGSLMALAGVALVVFNGSFILRINPAGDMLTLAAGLMWAFYCLILKRLQQEDYPILFVTRKVFFYGIVTLIPVLAVDPPAWNMKTVFSPVVLGNLLFLGLVASMLCYIMWNTAVARLGAIRATSYIYVVPLVTLVTSSIVLDERITWVALAGSALILCGVYVAERGFRFGFLKKAKGLSQ